MTLTELRYIVTLAQEQHFGRAAEKCFVSQPTLSIAVKKLEEELGVALFERSKTRVKPTPLGDTIVNQAQLVLEQTSAIKDMATAGKDQLKSPLQVGAIFTIGPYLLPHFIPELIKRAPDMPLYVEEGFTATLRHRLRNGELDVIIVALPFTEADVVTQPLYDEPFVVLTHKSHPLAEKEAIETEDLDGHNILLLGEGHCFRDQVFEACPNIRPSAENDNNASKIRTAAEGSSLETLRHMVASGLGITILPASAATSPFYNSGQLTVRPFAGIAPSRTVALAWRASFPRHKAVDVLRQAINQCQLERSS
ncbi:hydrogen peroxide-inducible genes activator [Sessilibacter corallicola]|uniref:Oxidative stress transcriptional regulator OxyR n=1 Tax=Sessilibacter corallicola TaxID=2904075 RepID=A0ABQ0A646_9GAMM|nr:hydrogen peroxide-inducible genes activator [Sessilibacter corallicola]MCE2027897.1 hydrogen peroxide-inducible genes activator [Sessilibacter corallicola]